MLDIFKYFPLNDIFEMLYKKSILVLSIFPTKKEVYKTINLMDFPSIDKRLAQQVFAMFTSLEISSNFPLVLEFFLICNMHS